MNKSLASIFAINQTETNISAINTSLTSIVVEISQSEASIFYCRSQPITSQYCSNQAMTRCHYPKERNVREPDAGSAEAAAAEGDQHLLPRHAAGRLQDRHQVQLLQTSTLLCTYQNMFFKESYPSSLTYLSKLYYYETCLLH